MLSIPTKSPSILFVLRLWQSVLYVVLILGANPAWADPCSQQNRQTEGLSQAILGCKQYLADLAPGSIERILASKKLSVMYRSSGDFVSAERMLIKLIDEVPQHAHKLSIGVYRQLGATYFYQQNFDQSFDAFSKALEIAQLNNESELIAHGFSDLAGIYQRLGDYETSSRLLLKSFDIHKQNDNEFGQALVLANLGNIYRSKHAYNEAIVSYRQAFELHNKLGNQFKAAHTLSSLARAFSLAGNAEQASDLLQQSAERFQNLNAYKAKAGTYLLLAELFVEEFSAEGAQQWLDRAKSVYSMVQSEQPVSKLWFIQGLIWQSQTHNEMAANAFEKSLAQITEDDDKSFTGRLYNSIAELKQQNKEYEEASKYWKLYSETLLSQLNQKDLINTSRIKSHFIFSPPLNNTKSNAETNLLYADTHVLAGIASLLVLGSGVYAYKRRKFTVNKKSDGVTTAATRTAMSVNEMNTAKQPPSARAISPALEIQETPELDEQSLRIMTVDLMLMAIQIWEEETNTGKLELAQQSKLWSVGIDDGRLRARALERYLNVSSLPQNPRWRAVVRTCHFVLRHAETATDEKHTLESQVRQYQQMMKTKALKK